MNTLNTKVLVATTTFYKSRKETRFLCAERLVQNCNDKGYSIIIVDGSLDPNIRKRFRDLGAVVYEQTESGMGGSRRELSSRAQEFMGPRGIMKSYRPILSPTDFILWTEPEKDKIVSWIPEIFAPIESGKADIVVPERSKKSLATMPRFQAASESIGDFVFQKATGIKAKPFFGPIAFIFEALEIFKNCNPLKYGAPDTWIQFFVLMEAAAAGYRIASVEVDFEYPPEQKEEEEGSRFREMMERRLELQLKPLIEGFYSAAEALCLSRR